MISKDDGAHVSLVHKRLATTKTTVSEPNVGDTVLHITLTR